MHNREVILYFIILNLFLLLFLLQESVIYLSESKSWMLDMFSRVVIQHDITSLEPLSCHQQIQKPNRTVVMDTAKIVSKIKNEYVFKVMSY